MKLILVVEDFIAVQMFLRETLESKGYKTLGAKDVDKAFDMLTNHKGEIDLVLTDYHMPDSTGYDLLKRLKEKPEFEKIPVIFISSETNPEVINKAKKLGFTAWIKKPYRSEVLLTELRRALAEN